MDMPPPSCLIIPCREAAGTPIMLAWLRLCCCNGCGGCGGRGVWSPKLEGGGGMGTMGMGPFIEVGGCSMAAAAAAVAAAADPLAPAAASGGSCAHIPSLGGKWGRPGSVAQSHRWVSEK
eukprot:1158313-Pelagomonas_calceolata.AAC.8